jgi:hypothetical protein
MMKIVEGMWEVLYRIEIGEIGGIELMCRD